MIFIEPVDLRSWHQCLGAEQHLTIVVLLLQHLFVVVCDDVGCGQNNYVAHQTK